MSLPVQTECDCHAVPDLASEIIPGNGWGDLAHRSEFRAVEQGHHAFVISVDEGPDMTRWSVVSNCRHGRSFSLTIWHKPGATLPAEVKCNCESGRYRGSTYPIPCKHAALVARSAERRGWLIWREGLWWDAGAYAERQRRDEKTDIPLPEDPFEGLGLPKEDEL